MELDQTPVEVLIIDQSTNETKVGLGTRQAPAFRFREPFFYRTKGAQSLKFGHKDCVFPGNEVPSQVYDIYTKEGRVLHWRLWTRFVLHLTELARVCPSKTCLFVIENPSHGKKNVEELTRMAFDVLKFHSIYVGSQPGLVVHSDTQSTYVIPIRQTEPLFMSLSKLEIGGNHITSLLHALLEKKYNINLPNEIVEKIKQELCFIAQENAEEAQEEAEKNFVPWCWEGVEIFDNIGRERVLAPEVLFDPQGIHEWVHYAINSCSGEKFEKELWQHIVLSGCNATIPGFSARLEHELQELAPDDVKVRIITHVHQPENLAFLGAQKTINFDSFGDFLIYRQDWRREGGEACLLRSMSQNSV